MFKLIVGVGNPGPQYSNTRHNVAWMILDKSPIFENSIWKSKFKGLYAEASLKGDKVYALKPQTFMNESGKAVRAITKPYTLDPKPLTLEPV
jgi:PTH1 family peptidyl-tRNA hydrolase